MARGILATFGAVWLAAGIGGVALGLGFADAIVGFLPPLAIDVEALGGAITAFGAGILLVGLVHVALAVALGRGTRLARTAAILLSAVGCAAMISLAAASAASAARESQLAALLAAAAVAAGIGAVVYALAVVRLTAEIRAGSGS